MGVGKRRLEGGEEEEANRSGGEEKEGGELGGGEKEKLGGGERRSLEIPDNVESSGDGTSIPMNRDCSKERSVLGEEEEEEGVTDDDNVGHETVKKEELKFYVNRGMPLETISLDVKALYPSITAERAAAVVVEQTEKTKVQFDNVDYRFAARYISKGTSELQIFLWGLQNFCPRRTKKGGKRPGMSGATEDDEKWTRGRLPKTRSEELKILGHTLSVATKKVYENNIYTFNGEKRIQKEGSPIGLDLSGEIGRLEMGDWDLKMANKLEENGIYVECNGRYVDDVDIVIEAIPPGWRFVEDESGGRLEYDDEWVIEDEKEPLDSHTMKILVKIADSIKPDLKFEGDCCSNNADGYLPVLDLKMKTVLITEKVENKEPISYYQIFFKFYKKEVARKSLMAANTAMAERMKRETMGNELVRRLLNTLPNLPKSEEETIEALDEFMVEMKSSGYKENFRKETLTNSVLGYKRKLLATGDPSGQKIYPDPEDESGQTKEDILQRLSSKPKQNLYREAIEGARERHNNRLTEKSSWFKKKIAKDGEKNEKKSDTEQKLPILKHPGVKKTHSARPGEKAGEVRETEGVVFVPHTQDSSLQKALQKVDDQFTSCMKIPRTRYIERAGTTLADLLVKKNPWLELKGGCERLDCLICASSGGKGTSCRRENICYAIECKLCEVAGEESSGEGTLEKNLLNEKKIVRYLGESSRSGYERIKEHVANFEARKEGKEEDGDFSSSSVLWLHSKEEHSGEMVAGDWRVKIISSHCTALGRQVTEAVKIRDSDPTVLLLNSKMEFGANILTNVVAGNTRGEEGGPRRKKRRREEYGVEVEVGGNIENSEGGSLRGKLITSKS